MNTAEKWNEIYRRYKDGGVDKTDAIIQLREAGVADWTTADLMLQADREPGQFLKTRPLPMLQGTLSDDGTRMEWEELPTRSVENVMEDRLDDSDDLRDVPDDELPGMWERSDFL